MSTSHAILDPACSGDDGFFDALIGLDRMCQYLALVLDDATPGGGAASEPCDGSLDGPPDEPPDGPLAAVLGLVSMRTTVALLLDALRDERADTEPAGAAAWSREHLR
jgi:hypothetical protein